MSSHFEGYLAFDVRPDAPEVVIKTLTYLTRSEDYLFDDFPSHEFFSITGWRDFLQFRHIPFGEPGFFWSDFHHSYRSTHQGKQIFRHTLSFRRIMHDDVEFNELWWYFLLWVAPYIETKGFVGFYRMTFFLQPTIIYASNGKLFTTEIDSTPRGLLNKEAWDGDPRHILPGWLKEEST
jgi:hypothetical protein